MMTKSNWQVTRSSKFFLVAGEKLEPTVVTKEGHRKAFHHRALRKLARVDASALIPPTRALAGVVKNDFLLRISIV
jgi:hypothetical protein